MNGTKTLVEWKAGWLDALLANHADYFHHIASATPPPTKHQATIPNGCMCDSDVGFVCDACGEDSLCKHLAGIDRLVQQFPEDPYYEGQEVVVDLLERQTLVTGFVISWNKDGVVVYVPAHSRNYDKEHQPIQIVDHRTAQHLFKRKRLVF